MNFLVRLIVTAASLWVAVWIVDGFEFEGSFWQFVLVAAIVGLVNAVAKPILTFFSLPFIIVTLGLFLLVVNALTLWFAVWLSGPDALDLGLTSTDFFWTTFLASIVVSVVGWILNVIIPEPD